MLIAREFHRNVPKSHPSKAAFDLLSHMYTKLPGTMSITQLLHCERANVITLFDSILDLIPVHCFLLLSIETTLLSLAASW
jgi:hypothetical protein